VRGGSPAAYRVATKRIEGALLHRTTRPKADAYSAWEWYQAEFAGPLIDSLVRKEHRRSCCLTRTAANQFVSCTHAQPPQSRLPDLLLQGQIR
jgi:hypothetical protein